MRLRRQSILGLLRHELPEKWLETRDEVNLKALQKHIQDRCDIGTLQGRRFLECYEGGDVAIHLYLRSKLRTIGGDQGNLCVISERKEFMNVPGKTQRPAI